MKKGSKVTIFLIAIFLPLVILGTNTYPVAAVTGIVTEDFTSTTFRDIINTNATKWGSGSVELPRDIHNITQKLVGAGYDRIKASDNFVYMVQFGVHIKSLDVSDPNNVTISDWWTGNGYPTDVWISGDYAYASCAVERDIPNSGLMQVVNITNPYDMATLGSGTTAVTESLVEICGQGNYVYSSSADNIFTFYVSNPTSPALVDSMYIGSVHDVAASNGYLYVLESTDFSVYDLSTPSNPVYEGSCSLGVSCTNLFVEGNYAYAGYANGMKIINLSNPASPAVVATYGTMHEVEGIFTAGNYTYLSSYYGGLIVLNITTRSSPLHLYTFDMFLCQAVCIHGNYAYVKYEYNPPDGYFGIWDVSGISDYTENAQAQSSVVFTSSTYSNITGSILRVSQMIPTGTSIAYFLSADDGLHWGEVTPNQYYEFEYPGKKLKWRAQLSTSDNTTTPIIYSLNITYYTKLYPVTLSSPINDIHISDDTPTLSWDSISEANEYILQLDTSPTYDSENFYNVTTTETEYTPASPLIDGRWYWQIIAVDSEGQRGWVCLTESFVVDTTGPEWDETPTNQTLELGLPFIYDLNASDISGIDYWWVNDTINFEINTNGVISNKTKIGIGTYGLEVRVYDSLDNYISETFALMIQDTLSPYWIVAPSNQVLDFGDSFSIELKVTDASAIQDWSISDTDNFGISDSWNNLDWTSTATIYNQTVLEPGTYLLTISVTDNQGNDLSNQITITVNESTSPTDTTTIGSFPITTIMLIGGIGVAIIIVGALIYKRGKLG